MIHFTKGDILRQEAEAIVNTVNCVGVMGRGIALQFKRAFPDNFKAYQLACKREQVRPGRMFIYDTQSFCNPRYIINFPTKRHWKGKSRLEDIQDGLDALVQEISNYNIKSIAVPPLGCGLGGLEWSVVRNEIVKAFQSLNGVDVFVFEPGGAPSTEQMVSEKKAPNMTIGRASLIGLMRRYLSAVMDPTVTLLELQKLMYFMQEAGEPLKLRYNKAQYGPYAQNLGHVLKVIEGHFVLGYRDGGDDPKKPLEIKSEAIEQAEEYLFDHQITKDRFQRVTNLIQGFETPYGMELLASIHWIVTKENVTDIESVTEFLYGWNNRKKMFPPKHIQLALDVLHQKEWV